MSLMKKRPSVRPMKSYDAYKAIYHLYSVLVSTKVVLDCFVIVILSVSLVLILVFCCYYCYFCCC